ncbi:hypothetical protein OPQ81_002209 [Rhizoctonia solani]|nr:hypothetical protein OPQ81_002209 [Rhizoctonia solani]
MLISNCPGLESLQLYMERYTESYSLEKVTTWMTAGVTIQCLRKLHLWGNIEIDEASFVSPLDTERYHFKDFLARHPRIEELTLGCTALRGFYGATNPECLAQVLPSLKRFSGPDCLCDLLIRSSLAKQLEYLTIEDVGFRSGKCFGPSKEYNVLALAALQELDIGTEIFPRALIILNAILPVAPELKRLGLSPVPPRHVSSLSLVNKFGY